MLAGVMTDVDFFTFVFKFSPPFLEGNLFCPIDPFISRAGVFAGSAVLTILGSGHEP